MHGGTFEILLRERQTGGVLEITSKITNPEKPASGRKIRQEIKERGRFRSMEK